MFAGDVPAAPVRSPQGAFCRPAAEFAGRRFQTFLGLAYFACHPAAEFAGGAPVAPLRSSQGTFCRPAVEFTGGASKTKKRKQVLVMLFQVSNQ